MFLTSTPASALLPARSPTPVVEYLAEYERKTDSAADSGNAR
jgi:hypothetical protein